MQHSEAWREPVGVWEVGKVRVPTPGCAVFRFVSLRGISVFLVKTQERSWKAAFTSLCFSLSRSTSLSYRDGTARPYPRQKIRRVPHGQRRNDHVCS